MEANDPQGVDNLDSRGRLAWFMNGTTRHYYILYKNALALMVINEKNLQVFLIIYLWELLIHRGMAILHLRPKFEGFM